MNDSTIYDSATLAIDPEYNYTITATPKKISKKRNYPLYKAVGYPYSQNGSPKGFPFIETLLELSKPEQQFMGVLLANLSLADNMAHIPKGLLPSWNAPKISTVYNKLKNRGIVKRGMKDHYMLNPDAMFDPRVYDLIKRKWDELP